MARTCVVCGAVYNYCPSCASDKTKPRWMATYDKESCRTIMNAIANWKANILSGEDAYKIIKDIKVDKLTPQLKEYYDELMSKYKPRQEYIATEICEKAIKDKNIVKTEEDEPKTVKFRKTRKRNKKKDNEDI